MKSKDGVRIWLRPVKLTDVDDIYEYAKSDKVGPMAGWLPHKSIEETEAIVKGWIIDGPINLNPSDKEIVYAIVYDKDNEFKSGGGKVVGTFGLTISNKPKNMRNHYVQKLLDEGKRVGQYGIVISEDYWGLGIATEVLKYENEYLFENNIVDIVVANCYEENIGSAKAQEKAGLNYIGYYEVDKPWWNTNCTTMQCRSLTQQEWFDKNNYKG